MTAGGSSDLMDQAMSTAAALSLCLPPSTIPIAAGYITFASSLALSTLVQLKILGISTGSPRPIPSLVGLASVALSSLASHNASIQAHALCRHYYTGASSSSQRRATSASFQLPRWQSEVLNFGAIQVDKQTLRM